MVSLSRLRIVVQLRIFDLHEPLQRTQSEDPPRSPFEIGSNQHHKSVFAHFDSQSRASSRQSDLETSKSDILTEQLLSYSRNLSQDSALSYRSMDSKESQDSISMMFTHREFPLNHHECIDFMEKITNRSYESNSLPRRKCIYHSDDYQTNSLPRRDLTQQSRQSCDNDSTASILPKFRAHGTFSLESTMGSNQNIADPMKRRYSCGVQETMRHLNNENDVQKLVRRNSTNNFYRASTREADDEYDEDGEEEGSEEYCSTCESESDDGERLEKEIFIDFKPRMSPVPSPRHRRKRLQKTLSDGEILVEKRRESGAMEEGIPASASEEDLISKEIERQNAYLYSNAPIKDEGICNKSNLLKLPNEHVRNRREAFRKRSISLEEPANDDDLDDDAIEARKSAKSGPPSPCLHDKDISTFPSSDSLATDLTRDHSDGNWNESQATVLQIDTM